MRFIYALLVSLLLAAPGCRKAETPTKTPAEGPAEEVKKNPKPETLAVRPEVRSEKPDTKNEKRETGSFDRAQDDIKSLVEKPRSGPSRTLDELLDLVSDRRTCNIVMGCEAKDGLVAIGAPAAKPIIQRYRTLGRPSYQKFHLIEILGYVSAPEVLPFLEERLTDPHWNARANAAIALARLKAVSKLGLLKRLLRKHSGGRDFGFLYALAYAVEKLGAGGGSAILLKGLTEESVGSINWGYTRIAAFAAADLGLKQACPDLVHSVLHNDIFLKKEAIGAAMALQCRDEKLAEAIAAQETSRIPSVRRKAAAAIEMLGSKK